MVNKLNESCKIKKGHPQYRILTRGTNICTCLHNSPKCTSLGRCIRQQVGFQFKVDSQIIAFVEIKKKPASLTDDTPQNTCYLHSTPSVVPHNRTHTIFPAQVDRSFFILSQFTWVFSDPCRSVARPFYPGQKKNQVSD